MQSFRSGFENGNISHFLFTWKLQLLSTVIWQEDLLDTSPWLGDGYKFSLVAMIGANFKLKEIDKRQMVKSYVCHVLKYVKQKITLRRII